MKALFAAAVIAVFAAAGFAIAQPIDDPREPIPEADDADLPSPQEAYAPPPVDDVEYNLIRRDARLVCGNRPDSMLDLVAWRIYRACMEIELDHALGAPE